MYRRFLFAVLYAGLLALSLVPLPLSFPAIPELVGFVLLVSAAVLILIGGTGLVLTKDNQRSQDR